MLSAVSKRLRIAAWVAVGLAALAGAGLLALPWFGRWVIARRLVPHVERMLGRHVEIGAIHVAAGRLVLTDVVVRGPRDPEGKPLARIDEIRASYAFGPALRGQIRLGEVTLVGPRVVLSRDADGADNVSDIFDRLRKRRKGGGGPSLRPARLRVKAATLEAVDARHGIALTLRDVTGQATPRGPIELVVSGAGMTSDFGSKAAAERIVLEAELPDLQRTARLAVEGGQAELWPGMALTGIVGTIAPDGSAPDGGDRAAIRLRGGYGGVRGQLWQAEGWLDPVRKEADLRLRADRFTLDKLAPILEGGPIQTPERASLETTLDVRVRGDEVAFEGRGSLAGLTLYDPWLALQPVEDLALEGSIQGRFHRASRRLDVEDLTVRFRGVTAHLSGFADLPRARRHLGLHVVVPPVPCQTALEAIPPAIAPRLQGFELAGTFSADVTVDIDWANLDALVLDGSVGLLSCRFTMAPKDIAPEVLLSDFEHYVEVAEDQWTSFRVGPSNPDFVPLYDVSPHLVNSLMTTEDSSFFKHRGFIAKEFRTALVKNLQEGYFKYGASSITMQMVKNVFLHRQKTLARKLQEAVLTHYVESTLGKERILEIYVNVIEFGPGIYGIGPAARHYFGKHPRDLNPVESAFFSSILPNPKQRYLQYCEGKLTRWGDAKIQRILKTMHERGRLSDEQYQAAVATPLVFDRTEALPEKECKQMVKELLARTRPTLPPRLPYEEALEDRATQERARDRGNQARPGASVAPRRSAVESVEVKPLPRPR